MLARSAAWSRKSLRAAQRASTSWRATTSARVPRIASAVRARSSFPSSVVTQQPRLARRRRRGYREQARQHARERARLLRRLVNAAALVGGRFRQRAVVGGCRRRCRLTPVPGNAPPFRADCQGVGVLAASPVDFPSCAGKMVREVPSDASHVDGGVGVTQMGPNSLVTVSQRSA